MSGKRIFFTPLGCAKNQVDGELMLGRAIAGGYQVVAHADDADLLVVNTCAFIDAAREESIGRILDLARVKAQAEGRRLVVTGCMAERHAEELAREIPEIDAMVGTGALDRFTDALTASSGATFRAGKHYLPSARMPRHLGDGDGAAYIKVSEGCDHECSFCIIPQIRGRHESRPVDDIVCEAESLVAAGVVEVNLVAQDLSAYGRDLGVKEGLAELLYALGQVPGLERVRCFYLYPNTLSDAALGAMASVENVCNYIDLPLQHADPSVLRGMRRGRGPQQLRALLDRVRARLGDPVLRTAFITGFPGESDKAFGRLLSFVEEACFDHVAVFRYSPEPDTPAARLKGRVPAHVAEFRRDRLLAAQEPITAQRLARHVGRRARVLVCGRDEAGGWYGRTDGQAPEVDGVTWLSGRWEGLAGRVAEVEITGSDGHDLYAEKPQAAPRDSANRLLTNGPGTTRVSPPRSGDS